MNIVGKIFARIVLNCLNYHLKQGLPPESQCGFRRHRGTADMIFAAHQLREKCQKIRTHMYSIFVDMTKAFDTVNREGLWKIMQEFDCLDRFTQMRPTLPHPPTPATKTDHTPESSKPSSSTASTSATPAHVPTTTAHNPDTQTNINSPTTNASGVDSILTCPHRDRASTSRIGLVGHLRIHRTETDEPVSGAPVYTRRTRLHCSHCHAHSPTA
nr:unnamed protein product [Spirometra erinaceieuropaei]